MFYKFLLIFANITGDTNDNNNDLSENKTKMAELPKELAKVKISETETNEEPEEDVVMSFTGLKKTKPRSKKDGKKDKKGEEVQVDVVKDVLELTTAADVIFFSILILWSSPSSD